MVKNVHCGEKQVGRDLIFIDFPILLHFKPQINEYN